MKIIILFLMVFLFFSCTLETEKTIETVIHEGSAWELAGINQQIFPIPEQTASLNEKVIDVFNTIFSNNMMLADVPVSQAIEDWDNGKMYKENSYSDILSCYYQTIHYLDIGTIVGLSEKLLVNVKFEMVDEANNAGFPNIHIRAKGSTSKWKLLNPNMLETDEILLITDDFGIVEWYADNGAPYQWDWINYGWLDIVGYADFYCIGVAIK